VCGCSTLCAFVNWHHNKLTSVSQEIARARSSLSYSPRLVLLSPFFPRRFISPAPPRCRMASPHKKGLLVFWHGVLHAMHGAGHLLLRCGSPQVKKQRMACTCRRRVWRCGCRNRVSPLLHHNTTLAPSVSFVAYRGSEDASYIHCIPINSPNHHVHSMR
jgi:hypothetical protein